MKKNILLTPGPTPLPPSVREALSRPVIHHRTREFGALFDRVVAGLRRILRTEKTTLMMAASGTGGMESAVVNLLSPQDEVLVLNTGVFGERFGKILKAYGLSPLILESEWGSAASAEAAVSFLKTHPRVKAVFMQHTDTSTGVLNDVGALARAVRGAAPEALIVVDAVSSLAAEKLEADAWDLDVVVAASQKGLMNAPGLAFAAVGDRAWRAAENSKLPRFYWDWKAMRTSLKNKQTPYTPPVGLVAAQAEALDLIEKEGLENVFKRTAGMAEFCRAWAKDRGLKLFAKDPAHILTAIRLAEGTDGDALIQRLRDEEGISIAGGQGALKGKIVRVAHMGYISQSDLEAGLGALDERLAAVKV